MANITTKTIIAINNEITAAVEEILTRHGMSATIGNVRFNDDSFSLTVSGKIVNLDTLEEKASQEMMRIKEVCTKRGLDFNKIYGKNLKVLNNTFKVVDADPRATKNNFYVQDKSGSIAKVSWKYVAHAI